MQEIFEFQSPRVCFKRCICSGFTVLYTKVKHIFYTYILLNYILLFYHTGLFYFALPFAFGSVRVELKLTRIFWTLNPFSDKFSPRQ